VLVRDRVGVESICWEADYPHSDSTWPRSPETLAPSLAGVPDEDVDKITHANALRHFRFDPFTHRPREACTVGALRAGATDVDIEVRARGNGERERATDAAYLTRRH
jgi:hypothetical protein